MSGTAESHADVIRFIGDLRRSDHLEGFRLTESKSTDESGGDAAVLFAAAGTVE